MNNVNYDTNSTLEKLYNLNKFTNDFEVPLHLGLSEIYREMVRQPESYFSAFYEILEMNNVPDSVKSITGYVAVHADLDIYMSFLNKAIILRKSNKITDDVLYRISAPGPPWLTKIVYNYKNKEVRETYKRIADSPEVAEYVSQYASRVLSGESSKSIREYMDAYPEMDNYWGEVRYRGRKEAELRNLKVSEPLIEKLKPYLGKKKQDACNALVKKPLELTAEEAEKFDAI